ncbi:Proteasome subunit alpha type [Entamoeba marina]
MSSIGSGYDDSCTTFSPDAKIFQVEYAKKLTSIAIKCVDGVVFGVEKLIISKMIEVSSNKRLFTIGKHIGITCAGFLPDARKLVKRAKEEYENYFNNFVAMYMQNYTLYGALRPFGCSLLIGGYDYHGYSLHYIEPSGTTYGYLANGIGKGKQICKNELEKIKFNEITCEEALVQVIKILDMCHAEWKDKPFELELSWVCPETNNLHMRVSDEKKQAAIDIARADKMQE